MLALIAAVMITVAIPLAAVEVLAPTENAASSEGDMPAVTAAAEQNS